MCLLLHYIHKDVVVDKALGRGLCVFITAVGASTKRVFITKLEAV